MDEPYLSYAELGSRCHGRWWPISQQQLSSQCSEIPVLGWRGLSSYENLLFLPRTQAQFPALPSGGLQFAALIPRGLVPSSGFCGYLHAHGTHKLMQVCV